MTCFTQGHNMGLLGAYDITAEVARPFDQIEEW